MKNKIPFPVYPIQLTFLFTLVFILMFHSLVIAQTHNPEPLIPDTLKPDSFKKNYGVNMAGVYTGSALGLNLNPSLFYRFKKNLVALGPNFQQEGLNLSGVQSYFQHDLTSNLRKTVLYYHMNLLYHIQANLGPQAVMPPSNNGPVPDTRHSAFEHYMGFGLRKQITKHINFDSGIGVGAYYSLNPDHHLQQTPTRSENDFSLLVKVGVTYDVRY